MRCDCECGACVVVIIEVLARTSAINLACSSSICLYLPFLSSPLPSRPPSLAPLLHLTLPSPLPTPSGHTRAPTLPGVAATHDCQLRPTTGGRLSTAHHHGNGQPNTTSCSNRRNVTRCTAPLPPPGIPHQRCDSVGHQENLCGPRVLPRA